MRRIWSLIPYWIKSPVDALRLRHNATYHNVWFSRDGQEETWMGGHNPRNWETLVSRRLWNPIAWLRLLFDNTCPFSGHQRRKS